MTDQASQSRPSGWSLDGFMTVAAIVILAASLLLSVSLFMPR
ncbi:MAG TPA: hypothetical protein VG387_18400 [Rhizomicrobium sp.]|jgi:hypothetical protein|nr:hypothetical protein [Rhizomicrobium sp.]